MAEIHNEKTYALKIRESADDGSDFSNPDADYRMLFLGEDGDLHLKDSAGTVTDIESAATHIADSSDAHDASAISVLDTAANFTGTDVEAVLAELQDNIDGVSGGGLVGQPVALMPPFPPVAMGTSTNNSADLAWATPIVVPSAMKVRGMSIEVTAAGAGSIEWGLFDYSSNAAAATKLAGGSAAPGGTGWRSIAATSAPVDVAAGCYILIWHNPAANQSTIRTLVSSSTVPLPWNLLQTSYTWSDTPDLTSASWVANSTMAAVYLEGDLDGSGNRWT